jgi:hypothetical protein
MTGIQTRSPMRAVVLLGALLSVTELVAQPYMSPYVGPYSGSAYPPFYPPANMNGWTPPMHPQPNVRDRFGGWESAWERWNQRMFGDTFANMFGDMGADFEVDATVRAQGEMDARGSSQGRGVQRSQVPRFYGQPFGWR